MNRPVCCGGTRLWLASRPSEIVDSKQINVTHTHPTFLSSIDAKACVGHPRLLLSPALIIKQQKRARLWLWIFKATLAFWDHVMI